MRLFEESVFVRIGWCAAAKEAKHRSAAYLVPGPRRDKNGVPGMDGSSFAIDFHQAFAFEDEVELLCEAVIMALGGTTFTELSFRKALIANGRIGEVENAANSRAIFSGEGFLIFQIENVHWL